MFKSIARFVAPLLAVVAVATVASAGTYTCAYYNPFIPGQCLSWEPGMLPGAAWCSGDPDANHVNVYTSTNYTGWCQTVPVSTIVGNMSAYGWNNTTPTVTTVFHVNSVKVGPGRIVDSYSSTSFLCNAQYPCHGFNANTPDTSGWSFAALRVQ